MKKVGTWAQHIDRCAQLGVSKKSYCEENNLSYPLFFYHQRKLSENKSSVGFKEIILENEVRHSRRSDGSIEPVLHVQFANGSTLVFSEHFLDRVYKLCQTQ